MAIYLGNSEKLKIVVNGKTCGLQVPTAIPVTNGIRLLSSEGYILKDSNGLYLTSKEDK